MNRIYRVVWNACKGSWQVVSEFGSGPAKTSTARARRRAQAALLLAAASSAALAADPLPSGGRVVAGQASISSAGQTMTIQQSSAKTAIDWTRFSIAKGGVVDFVQPSASAVALNRVTGADPSLIQGALYANGHVFLINPNGVLFGPTAQVDVGGLLASTLSMTTDDFLAGRYHLAGGSANAVENQGRIQAAAGGNIALVAARVVNAGQLAADQGNVLLGAGSDVLVDFGGPVKLQVQKGALDALVENGGAIRADGGTVLLTAKSASELSGSVINNSGIIQARTLATGEQGHILLLGDMQSGALHAGGTLDASAPLAGNGGNIETSAASVQNGADLVVNAGAARGTGGQWLIDPYDYTIDAAAASTIANSLNQGTSVTVSTQVSDASKGGAAASGNGDITVASPIAKSAGGDASLTLKADRNILLNSDITSTSGKLNLTLSSANAAGATFGGVDVNANLMTNGGNILIGGGNVLNGIAYALNTGASAPAVSVEGGKTILSGGGNITINGRSLQDSSGGSYSGTGGGVYIKSGATILSGTGNLLVNAESDVSNTTFALAFEAASGTVTTVGSSPNGGTMLLSAVNATPNSTADQLMKGAVGLTANGTVDRIVFQGPAVGDWLIYINGAPQLSGYTQASQLASTCTGPYPNCGVMVVPGSNHSYLYATYQAVDMSTLPLYVIQTGAASKVYDGTTTATGLHYTTLGGPAGFGVSSLTPNPVFYTSSKKVGSYASLTPDAANPSDYTSGGGAYSVGYFSNGSYAITPKTLTPSAADKVYDGSATAAVSVAGAIAGDNVTASGSGSFAGKNVGAYTVSIDGITLGGSDAGNYTLSGSSASATASILPRTVTISAGKTYDGSASLSGVTLGNLVAGEDLSASGASANSANVATASYVNALTLGDGTAGLASNYQLPSLAAASSANSALITPRALTISGVTAADKVYDGTTTASLSGGVLSGLVGGDTLGISGLGGSFADKNAGAGKAVTLSTINLSDGSGLASNYSVIQPTGITATITPAALTVSGITASDKTYDGGTLANVSAANASLQGLVAGDHVSVSASGVFADPNAGSGKSVALASNYGGADAGNYTIAGQSSATASITPKALTISGMTALDKVYDGSTAATLSGGALSGLVGGETVGFSGAAGAFADKNAGAGKAVIVTGITLTDGSGLASNYTFSQPTGVRASITPKALIVSGIAAADKTYDGNTSASVSTANASLQGLVAGDSVSVTASGNFADPNAGAGKLVALSSTYGGADAGNYAITGQSATTAGITPKALTISGLAVADKVYDGSTTATLAGGLLSGLVGNQTLGLGGLTGSFADKNAGAGKAVTVGGQLLDGSGLASNYTLAQPTGLTGAITPRALTVSGITAVDKTYDGSTVAALSTANASLQGLVAGDSVTVSATGAFADKKVGNAKAVTLTSSYGGSDAANYAIQGQTSATASITPRALTVSGIAAADKTYDGGTSANVSVASASLQGLVTGDQVTVSASGSFADKNAGSGKTVALTSSYGGIDAANYTITGQTSATASIARKALTVTGITAADKTYDGTTAASVSAVGAKLQGLVAGDSVSVSASGTFADKNAGAGKTVTLSPTFGGADAANYTIQGQATTTAGIAQKALTVSGITASDKVYDGGTGATVSTANASLQGLVAGDQVGLSASGSFADKNAGSGKQVTLSDGVQGADAANYAVTAQASATASITPRALSVSGVTVADKVADGGTSASLSTPGALVGVVANDSVSLDGSAATAQFAQATPGAGIAVNVGGLALSGPDAGNYAFAGTAATTGTIRSAVPAAPAVSASGTSASSVTAATIAPQNQGIVSVLQPPAVGGMAYLAVPDQAAGNAGADGQGDQAAAPGVSATERRQSSSQPTGNGRNVKFLNVLVVSGGIRMPAPQAPNP